MSWPGGCLGGTSVPSGTVVVSLDGAGAPTRVWVLRPLPPLFTVGVPSLLSPDICPCCFSELRSLWCKPGLWPRQGGQQLPGMARAVRSAGASASMLTGLPGQVGPADTQQVGVLSPEDPASRLHGLLPRAFWTDLRVRSSDRRSGRPAARPPSGLGPSPALQPDTKPLPWFPFLLALPSGEALPVLLWSTICILSSVHLGLRGHQECQQAVC